jgi:DNA (cytosine-5)-methyltransferase 3A
MNILSLFGGMECGSVACERARIKVDKYYYSEVDKYAIQIAKKNHPNIIELGDVTKWKEWDIDWSSIGLLLGGSPCQGFSFAGKQLNFEDPRSKLFFEYAEILKHIQNVNPEVIFMLENVKMKVEHQAVISEYLGVEPITINSSLVSAQNRKRIYWTNINGVTEPTDKEIMLKDIVHENVDKLSDEVLNSYKVPFDKTLLILDKEVQRGKVGYFRQDSQANRVYYIHGKSVTLCGEAGGGAAKMGQYLFGCITPDRINKRQNGQRFSEGNKFYTLTAQDKHGVLIEGYIRKLTPIECERLQTLPDNYTEGVSNSQRYKMLGNGWTVDIIAHILSFMK